MASLRGLIEPFSICWLQLLMNIHLNGIVTSDVCALRTTLAFTPLLDTRPFS